MDRFGLLIFNTEGCAGRLKNSKVAVIPEVGGLLINSKSNAAHLPSLLNI